MFQRLEADIEVFEGGAYGTHVLIDCDTTWDTLTNFVMPKSA
jgi:hypothetical protein